MRPPLLSRIVVSFSFARGAVISMCLRISIKVNRLSSIRGMSVCDNSLLLMQESMSISTR